MYKFKYSLEKHIRILNNSIHNSDFTLVDGASFFIMNVFVSFSASFFVNTCLGSPMGYDLYE